MVTMKNAENQEISGFLIDKKIYYVNKRNPHLEVDVFNIPNVDNVDKLFGKKVFTDIYYISGSHSYQQVTVHTFFF